MKKLLTVIALLFISHTASAIDADGCVKAFKLSGKTDEQFKNITPNEWNNKILPKEWIDKGGHFLTRMKEADRAGAAGLYTPSDLQSFVMGGTLIDQGNGRYFVQQIMVKKYNVVFDVTKHQCELVTFLIG